MKVGLVVEAFDPRRGGVENWTCQFARRVLAAGHEVHVVAGGFAPEARQPGIVEHRIECPATRSGFALAAEQKLRGLNLDVIHDSGCGWYCDVLQPHGGSRIAAFRQNLLLLPRWARPLKRQMESWLPRYRDFRQLVRRQYSDPRRIFVAISQMVSRDLIRYHGVRPEQVRLIYNGVDLERFSPVHRQRYRQTIRDQLGVAQEELLLLIVAHNFRLKGVPTALAAVGRLVAEGLPVRLAVAGGKHPGRYLKMAHRVGAAAVTSFLGSVLDPVPYYAAADVYVQPTFYDPCSLVVLEALAAGLPVVTSRYNGAGELIREGIEGHVLDDPADDEQLALCLRPLCDATLRRQMAAAARQLALRHSLAHNCRQMLEVYGEVAARHGRAA